MMQSQNQCDRKMQAMRNLLHKDIVKDQTTIPRINSSHLSQVIVYTMRKLLLAAIVIQAAICPLYPASTAAQLYAAEHSEMSLLTEELHIQVRGERISLDVRDIEISNVLRVLAQKAAVNIALGAGVSGKITMKLTDVPIEEALKYLCQSSALVYEYLPDSKTYRVIQAVVVTGSKGKTGRDTETYGGIRRETKPAVSTVLSNNLKLLPETPVSPANPDLIAKMPKRPSYKSGELLVRFKQDATAQEIKKLHHSLGNTVLRSIHNLRLQRIKLREGLSEESAMALYRTADVVEHVEQHALRYPHLTPNDPNISQQWGITKIKAREAWDITQGRPEVIVAVIDTGVDYRHPDLQENIWLNTAELKGSDNVDDDGNGYIDDIRGWDFVGNDAVNPKADADPMDMYGHGTHVAGIIAAVGNNGQGIAGINWQAKIMALKVQADFGEYFEDFAIIEAIQYAIAKGAKIINCSFGGDSRSDNEEKAFIALKKAGIIAVCAAGNDGLNTDTAPIYPSGYNLDNIISVAASDTNDNLATFSNYGLNSVDVMAPGVNIFSTVPEGTSTDARIKVLNQLEYPAIGMVFAGKTDVNGITGTAYDCGKGYPEEFPAAVRGNLALIERGNRDGKDFYFSEKVRNAQTAGALGVIIYNNIEDDFDLHGGTLSSPGNPLWVPVVSITKASGLALKALRPPPIVTLINSLTVSPYKALSGTSMAAPHVAGITGLIMAQCPSLRYDEIKSLLLHTVDKVPAVANKMVSGGRVNAFAALTNILLPEDISGDGRIGLDDAILALQMLSGLPRLTPYSYPTCRKDVNGDSTIGLQEAIFILQKVAGMR